MPVDQIPSRVVGRSRDDAKIVQYHDYIDQKIDSTRRMVKVVDLATGLVELLVAVMLFLLLVIVAEHWIVPGGLPSAVRVILFLVLGAGCCYFAVRRLWPLCVRAINPVYAAHAIEQGSPTLKNGLVNLLLFRDRRKEISDAVYHTLEEQAAHGLTRVPADTAVDQTELIRLGYVLVGIVAVAGLYKVFSPKDPFVAAERVLMPWSNILPASRVTITDVKPGTEVISQGEAVEVSAEVRGLSDDDTVAVRYSTEDGQIVGRAIPLRLSADKMRYQARLADGAEGVISGGVTRNLKYHIEAGDAHSLTYSLTVVPAATILVERIEYHYPKYTGLIDQSVDGVGDIRAIEGTKVTIFARANGAIREANVDFDADGRPDLQMATEDAKAHVQFELGLRDDRQTPQHASYVLRFANAEGRANHDPVKYSINVEPDKRPEAEILTPREKSRDARMDESVKVEVEARDPDFALSALRLRGQVAGRDVLSESLLKEEHHGPFTGRFAFVAAARGLKEGDVLEYWAEADDNRAPKPNTVTTEHKSLRIVASNAPPPQQDRKSQNDRQQPKDGGQPQKDQQQKGEQNQKNEQGQQGKSSDSQSGGDNGKGQQNQGGQGQQGQGQGQGDKQQGDKQQGDKSQSGQSNGDQQSGGGEQNKQSSGLKQNQTGSGGGDKSNQHDGQGQDGQEGGQSASNDPSSKKPDQQGQNKQTGAGAAGGESSKDGARPDANKSQDQNASGDKSNSGEQKSGDQKSGEQPNGSQPDGSQPKGAKPDGSKQDGSKQDGSQGQAQKGQKSDQQSGEKQSPVSSEGDDDAEAFNRIQKQMEKSGELKAGENSKEGESKPDQGQQGEKQRGSGQQKQQTSKQGQSGQSGEENGGEQNGDSQQKKDGGGAKDSSSQQQGSENSKPGEKKQGGAQSGAENGKQRDKSGGETKKEQSSDGGQSTSKGSGGSGNEEKKQSSPNSEQPGVKPTDKPEQAGSKDGNKNGQEPPSGAGGKKESDSHGDQGGDKAGGGSEGSGQKSPHDGTGSTGQNQSADTGNGQSGEHGKGDTSNAGGKDAKSDQRTGSSDGKTPGKGSEQRDGAGDKSGGKQGDQQGASGSQSKQDQAGQNGEGMKQSQGDKQGQKQDGTKDGNKSDNKQGDPQGGKKDGERSNDPSKQKSDQPQNSKDDGGNTQSGSGGSGEPGGAVNPQKSISGEAAEGDAANLEYARKQTDLVVGKLADQLNRKKVDKDLLKELGWSEDDLKKFVDRWQQRKAAAEQGNESGDAAKRELDDALRSLGLRQGELQQNAVQKDSMRDVHEGYRGPVPAQYKDRLRAYNQGVSRAKHDEEKN